MKGRQFPGMPKGWLWHGEAAWFPRLDRRGASLVYAVYPALSVPSGELTTAQRLLLRGDDPVRRRRTDKAGAHASRRGGPTLLGTP